MPRIDRLSPSAAANSLAAAGRQLKAWWSTGRDDAKTPPGLYGKLSLFTFSVFCLNALALLYFHIAANYGRFYVGGRQEDTLVELLTVPLFAASSLALFLVAVAAGRGWLRRFYILVGLGALFVAGEELSWGQHILGFATPDFWKEINQSEEINLHNNYALFGVFNLAHLVGVTLLYGATIVLFVLRKYRLGALPLPSLWLAFFFALSLSYYDFTKVSYPEELSLLPILGIFLWAALLRRDRRLLLAVGAVTALSCATVFLHDKFPRPSGGFIGGETGEYLLSLAVFLYSIQLLRDSGGARWLAWSRRIKAHRFRPRRRAAELPSPPPNRYKRFQRPGLAISFLAVGLAGGLPGRSFVQYRTGPFRPATYRRS